MKLLRCFSKWKRRLGFDFENVSRGGLGGIWLPVGLVDHSCHSKENHAGVLKKLELLEQKK